MSETLYRKYRPKNFSEIIGQAHIVRTLSNAVKNGRVGQAYLFTGPRGTGKTSIARILAKTVNCEKPKGAVTCEKCEACKLISENKTLDIIEIDAASNTGVDNIRELRETVALPPTKLKYKVYIIDEVHMLSTGAFNALLKTLEEPPAHVIFILATTEIHKVPETIISRCQRFDFARLPIENIIERLSLIAKKEKVKIDKEALEMIAISAEGGMRDAESLLSQIISLEDKEITAAEVREILGTAEQKSVFEIAKHIISKETSEAIQKINYLASDGYDLAVFNKSLINHFRQIMLLKINDKLSDFFTYEMTKEQIKNMAGLAKQAELSEIIAAINLLLEAQSKISSSILPQLPLEIAIIKATQDMEHITYNMKHEAPYKKAEIHDKKNNKQSEKIPLRPLAGEGGSALAESVEGKSSEESNINLSIDLIKDNWNKLLSEIKPYNHSLNALLSNCQIVGVKNSEITIATPYDFYRERLMENGNRLTIEKVFSNILGSKISVLMITDRNIAPQKQPESKEPPKESVQDPLLASALEIMGGKIVEE